MPNRRKVIKGLNNISREIINTLGHGEAISYLRTIDDAIALLQEQEPIWNDVLNVWTCPSCGQMVSTNYCRDCGKKVKWE